jgi:hypothetical protein
MLTFLIRRVCLEIIGIEEISKWFPRQGEGIMAEVENIQTCGAMDER